LAPSDICDYVQEYYPPKKIDPLPESGSVTHVVDDDFVFPVRTREIEEANEHDVEDLDIEKALEKVFAENDKNELEKKMNDLYLTGLENPQMQTGDRQVFSYSLMSIDHQLHIPQMPLSLRQTRIDGNDMKNIETSKPIFSNLEQAEVSFDQSNELKKSSPPITKSLISEAKDLRESDRKLVSKTEEGSNALSHVNLEKKKCRNRQESFEQELRNLEQEEEDEKIFRDEIVPYRSPSQVISDFSDSGHDELIFSNPDTPSDYPVPSRPQTLLLTSNMSNNDSLYNYKQNLQSVDDHINQENICFNPSEEMQDLIGTFADANPQPYKDNHNNGRLNQIDNEGQSIAKETSKRCLVTESGLTFCRTTTASTSSGASNGHRTSTTTMAKCSTTMSQGSATITQCSTTMGQCSATSQSSGFISWGGGAAENLLVNKTGGKMMLWKKVQNVVVVCGEMVNSNSGTNPDSNSTSENRRNDLRRIQRQQQQSLD
jgi:hypothetical protein